MRRKTLILVIIAQIIFCQFVVGQERGVVNVLVKQNNGRRQEEILYRNSYALLIGNSDYAEWNSLSGVERDIPQVEAVLRDKHGFTVEKALNLSKKELLNRIDEFISRYGQDYENRLLIYYAGHGYTAVLPDRRVMGYLVMKDAPVVPPVEESLLKTPKNFSEFRLRAISMDDIEKLAKEISTRHALFVFDSCFSGTALYRDNVITVPQEVSTEELEQMRGFLTAGNERQRVRDDSPFRRAFIKGLEGKADANGDGIIFSSELGAFVKREVYLETRNTALPQSPIFGKQQNFTRGDMVFVIPTKDSLLPAALAWNNFRGFAKNLLKYEEVGRLKGDLIAVKLNNKIGLINKTGGLVVQPKYDNFLSLSDEGGIYSMGKVTDLSDGDLKYIFRGDFAAVEINNKVGLINITGKELTPFKYDWLYPFTEGLAVVCIGNGKTAKYGAIDKMGKEVIPVKYDDMEPFSNNLAKVKLNNRYGFINKLGTEVIKLKYDEVETFSEGLAAVVLNGKYGFINNKGNLIIPMKFMASETEDEEASFPESIFKEGLAVITFDLKKYGVIDKTGKIVVPARYDSIGNFSEGLAAVGMNGKYGFIDRTGKEVIPLKYNRVYSFLEGLVKVELHEEVEDVSSSSKGTVEVEVNIKEGFIDQTGKEVIPVKYDSVYWFSEGMARVWINGKYNYIDKNGKELIPSKYDDSYTFSENLIKVIIGDARTGKYGVIDKNGKEIISAKYDSIWCEALVNEGFLGVILNGKKGFVDIYGNEYFDF